MEEEEKKDVQSYYSSPFDDSLQPDNPPPVENDSQSKYVENYGDVVKNYGGVILTCIGFYYVTLFAFIEKIPAFSFIQQCFLMVAFVSFSLAILAPVVSYLRTIDVKGDTAIFISTLSFILAVISTCLVAGLTIFDNKNASKTNKTIPIVIDTTKIAIPENTTSFTLNKIVGKETVSVSYSIKSAPIPTKIKSNNNPQPTKTESPSPE